jgi:hypothetical protein
VEPPVLPPLPVVGVDALPSTRAIAAVIEGSTGFKVTSLDCLKPEDVELRVSFLP